MGLGLGFGLELGFGSAATMAASLSRFSSEAPEKPVVREAMLESSTVSARGLPLACTLRIFSRPLRSGRSTWLGVGVGVGVG